MKSKQHPAQQQADALTQRARKFVRRDEPRKAMLALREAVHLDPCPLRFTRFGALLAKTGRDREAIEALKQALFMFRSASQRGKARTVARMILTLDPCEPSAVRAA